MARRQTEEVDLGALLSEIRRDPKYKTFKTIVQTAEEKLDIERDRKEVFGLHSARTSRSIYGKKQFNPSYVMQAEANDMQARSRMAEIKAKAYLQIELVEAALEAIQDHVLTEYNEEVRKYSNEAQRKALIRRIQKAASNIITDGRGLMNLCDTFIADIDKASYHLSNITELIKQLSGGKVI